MSRDTITVSAAKKFNNCPRAYYYRYVAELVPAGRTDSALGIGRAVHDALEIWHRDGDFATAGSGLMAATYHNEYDRAKAAAMFFVYVHRYPTETFTPVELERVVDAPLRNPDTGRPSRLFEYRGKLDGDVERKGRWLLEHKTAASVNRAYLEKLWMDLQIHAYAPVLASIIGEPVEGVIYNVLLKPSLKPYTANTKRPRDETPEEYWLRCVEWCLRPDSYHREELLLSDVQIAETAHDLWQTAQAIIWTRQQARRVGIHAWRRNTDRCQDYYRDCDYCPLCRSGGNSLLIDTLYEHKQAHSELTTDTATEPIF